MSNFAGESSRGTEFHTVQAERDLQSNWSVDLHRLLEEYLAKICAGEIPSEEDDRRIQVNFAEGAIFTVVLGPNVFGFSKVIRF